MAATTEYSMTKQQVRDLDQPPHDTEVNVGPDERALSTVGGAVLAGFGVGIGGMAGCLLATVGGAIAYRGVTGHCSAYAAAGVSTAGRGDRS
ncbi:YgaP family membrane protein [Zavarzinella formosa]|uniref:YgaP family membrane protein n=1 Tax=Zavarzinella formosa TaxID=360055 RepID=UPI0002E6FD22|nr:DUF2892 domain-containing protein [Zavarzinella formosa]